MTQGGPEHFKSPVGTWDEWLVVRSSPSPGTPSSDADTVAAFMRLDPLLLDFGMPTLRDGLRALFDEFERDTAGQEVTLRAPKMRSGKLSISVVPTHTQVRVVMGQPDGSDEPLAVDLEKGQALELAQRILDVIGTIDPFAG